MTAESEQPRIRRVRPWIAALLTFLGWGLGFYYARRSRSAVIWAFAPVMVGLVLALGVWAYFLRAEHLPSFFRDMQPWMMDAANLALTAVVAIFAWIAAARQREVPRASPVRLLGYLAIWLAPFLVMLVPMSVRFFYMQPFRVPAGSMEPTLHVGDFMLVSKASYGYGPYSTAPFLGLVQRDPNDVRAPQRGDVAVFRPVSEPDRDFVKRVIGLPGDRIQMIGGVLHINGVAVTLESLGAVMTDAGEGQSYRETLPNGVNYVVLDMGDTELDNTREFVVPEGNYFVMGDHRDNSADSRVTFVGFVPVENFIGRVDRIVHGEEN